MAELTTVETFEGSQDEVFSGIGAFKLYPEYIPGVTGIQILPAKKAGSTCQVRFELKIIKSFYYTLNMFEEKPNRIWWDLDDSNIMKKSLGSWTLKAADGGKKTQATYSLDITFKGLVPGTIVDQVTKTSLPATMQGFHKLIAASRKGR